jgi:hypothetical protein
MKLKFAEFQTLDDQVIGFALEEAELFLGTWSSGARDIAHMYLAAHFLSVSAASADSDGREITHETIGRISTTYKASAPAQGESIGDLMTTQYGNRYIQLKNLGNPRFKTVGGNPSRFGGRWC